MSHAPYATYSPAMRRLHLVVFATTIAITLSSFVAVAFAPILVRDAPLMLLLLQPTSAQMLLVSAKLDFVTFVGVATVRRMISDLAFFLLGMWYGERAVAWIKRKAGRRAGVVESIERNFPKVSQPLIFFFVSPPVSILAGATGMRLRFFVALKLAGTLVIVLAHRFIADAASGPIAVVVRFISDNAVPLTAVTTLIAVAMLWMQRRNGRPVFDTARELDILTTADTLETPPMSVATEQRSV